MARKPTIASRPKNVEGQNAIRTQFYREKLTTLVKGIFKVECPDYCDKDYILNTLLFSGYIIVTDTPAGVLPLKGSLYGYNYQNIQTKAIIVVPTIKEMKRKIGKDCELIYLERKPSRVFYTYGELIDVYAEKLAAYDAGIEVNVINSKLAYLAETETKAQAEAFKMLFDKVIDGEPLVLYKKDSLSTAQLNLFFNNLKQNFICPEIQDAKRTTINEFLTFIGVNNANTDKKERLIVNEVEANDAELKCNTALFKSNLETCMKKVHAMFPDFKFSITMPFSEEGSGKSDTVRNSTDVGNATQ